MSALPPICRRPPPPPPPPPAPIHLPGSTKCCRHGILQRQRVPGPRPGAPGPPGGAGAAAGARQAQRRCAASGGGAPWLCVILNSKAYPDYSSRAPYAEEAAFLEGAELVAEVQALLPLVRDAARPTGWNPAPEAGDRVAARRRHLLAFAKFARADCIGPQLSPYRHEAEYALKVRWVGCLVCAYQ